MTAEFEDGEMAVRPSANPTWDDQAFAGSSVAPAGYGTGQAISFPERRTIARLARSAIRPYGTALFLVAAALQQGSDAQLGDLARLAIAAFGRGEGSGVLGVDVQRIRRALGLRTEPQPDLPDDAPRRGGVPRDQLRRLRLFSETQHAVIKRARLFLPPGRHCNQDMVDATNCHDTPRLSVDAVIP